MYRRLGHLLVWSSLGVVQIAPALGEEFRVDNRVFVGNAKVAASVSETLFQAGVAYDFLSDPDEVTVFDIHHQRIILLDPMRRLRAQFSTADVQGFNQQQRIAAQRQRNEFLNFLIDPRFVERFDPETGELLLESPFLTYRLETVAADNGQALQQYLAFSDWSARTGPLLDPRTRPPYARLAVNQALARRQRVPEAVHLTIERPGPLRGAQQTLRSEHRMQWRLLAEDKRRIDETREWLVTFESVEPAQFVRREEDQAGR